MDEEFDYIVVGAGSAGCIVASRLTEDPSICVLLVEAGGSDQSPIIAMPGALPFATRASGSGGATESGPEPHLGGKTIDEKAGKVIGGTSSINAMIFNRGSPMDYDGWADDGLADWDYAHCLPYFRKMETFSGGPDDWRGGDGPLHVSRCQAKHKLYDAFLRSGEQAGFEVTPDHNGHRQEGMHVAQSFIHNGLRWSSSRAYLRRAVKRPNLRVISKTLVARVLFAKDTAIGVEVADRQGRRTITCEREVILCAGAVNTPKLLMLSRDRARRRAAQPRHRCGGGRRRGGPQSAESPRCRPAVQDQIRGLADRQAEPVRPSQAGGGLGSSAQRARNDQLFRDGGLPAHPHRRRLPQHAIRVPAAHPEIGQRRTHPDPGVSGMDGPVPHGESRFVRLRSANPADAPWIVFNHMQSRQDMQDMIEGIGLTRTLVSQSALAKYRREELTPGCDVTSDIEIEAFVRQATGTSYHPSTTCRMGVDADAVVDSDARVNAVCRLRIVDASIMPKTVTGNLNAPVMMMAEKVSDRILGKTSLPASRAVYDRSLAA